MRVFLPGLLIELTGIFVLAFGLLNDRSSFIVAGIVILVLAIAMHIHEFFRKDLHGSPAPVPEPVPEPAHGASPESVAGSQVLYTDGLVRITGDSITFLNYSLFRRSRTIVFADVDRIDVKKPGIGTGKYRIWGSGDLRTWFPLDMKRSSRDRIFHLRLNGRGMHVGFTVENSGEVTGILRKKGLIGSEEPIG